jgi:hypothetical protein
VRHVVGPGVVLGLGQVDARLPAVRGVHLRDQRGGRLDHGNAALVGGRAESCEVAHDPAAEGQHAVVATRALPSELAQDALGLGKRLCGLAARDIDRRRNGRQAIAVMAKRLGVGDREPAAGLRRRGAVLLGAAGRHRVGKPKRAAGDNRRIFARAGRGPREARPFQRRRCPQPRRRQARDALAAVGQEGVGQPFVDRLAGCEPAGELGPVPGQRAVGVVRAALPRGRLGDPAPDGETALERLLHPLRLDGAPAERYQAAGHQRLERQTLLDLAETCLALTGEHLGRRSTKLALHLPVHVDGPLAEHGGRALGGAGLAGSHEANEGDRGLGRRSFGI